MKQKLRNPRSLQETRLSFRLEGPVTTRAEFPGGPGVPFSPGSWRRLNSFEGASPTATSHLECDVGDF
ncbi:hypothetical protein CapIbe_017850 [Capra ibex]